MKSQGGFAIFTLLSVTCLIAHAQVDTCWDSCFGEDVDTPDFMYSKIYDEVLKTVLEIKNIIDTYNIKKIGFAIDASFSLDEDKYPVAVPNPSSKYETSEAVFWYQFMLGHILTFTLDNAPYIVQFDQKAAWGCEGYQGVNPCNFTRGFRAMQTPLPSPGSYCPDNIETACSLLSNFMTTVSSDITSPGDEAILIAIVNSDFYSHENDLHNHDPLCQNFHRRDESSILSSCSEKFKHRYVIGVKHETHKYMKQFVSEDGNYRRLSANSFSYRAIYNLYYCVNIPGERPCCPPPAQAPITSQPISCSITQGTYGETIADYPDYFPLTTGLQPSAPEFL